MIAAQVFAALIFVVVLFQLALALGAPWGHLAMGGRYPGKFPTPMRIAALAQAFVLIAFAFVVLVRGKVISSDFYDLTESAIWGIVILLGLSFVMHLFTPSRWERILWTPVVVGLLISSLVVSLS